MFDYISGNLAYADNKIAVIDCSGVGYKCYISAMTYRKIYDKDNIKLFTFLNVKEDVMDLYGFADSQERELFLLLNTVSGVGPKAGLAMLSELDTDQIINSVLSGNYKLLTSASGIGIKTAQRICLELKDKINTLNSNLSSTDTAVSKSSEIKDEATEVLMALGYSIADTKYAIEKCSADNTNDIVKQALRVLSQVK